MNNRRAPVTVVLGAAALVSACGGHSSPGGVPVKTVNVPAVTETISNQSSSMEPLIHCGRPAQGCEGPQNDSLVVRKPPGRLNRGNILIFRAPPLATTACGSGGIFVKRLIGAPGDAWAERNGYVYINGKKLNEPYILPDRRDDRTLGLSDLPPRNKYTRIPKDYYLMMGDNRKLSCDSRVYGLVPRSDMIGRVVQILRPSG